VVTHQLQVERRTGKARRPKTDVQPLCCATNYKYDRQTDTRLMASFRHNLSKMAPETKFSSIPYILQHKFSFWTLMKQETMGWQRHQLDRMQIICTSLKTDNHTSTSSLNSFTRRLLLTLNQQYQSTEGKNNQA